MVAGTLAGQSGAIDRVMENLDDGNMADRELRRILEAPVGDDEAWAQPDERVWEGLSRALDRRSRRRRSFLWWFGASGLALLLFLVWLVPRQVVEEGKAIRASGGHTGRLLAPQLTEEEGRIYGKAKHQDGEMLLDAELHAPASLKTVDPEGHMNRRAYADTVTTSGTADGRIEDAETRNPDIPKASSDTLATAPSAAPPAEVDAMRMAEAFEPLGSRGKVPLLAVNAQAPSLSAVLAVAPQRRGTQRILFYGHGTNAGMDWQRRRPGLPGPSPFLEDPVSQRFEALRIGTGWEWQFTSGWFLGTGMEFQSVREETERALLWRFTRKGGMPSPGGFNQQLALALPGGFGISSADLRVSVRELQNTQDYQEGDSVSLALTLRQQIRQVRLPVLAGYRIQHGRFFGEIRAGVGVSFHADFDAELSRLADERNRMGLQRPIRLMRSPQLNRTLLDVQAGAAAGLRMVHGLELAIGWDGWRTLVPSVEHQEVQGFLQGSGVSAGIRWELPGLER